MTDNFVAMWHIYYILIFPKSAFPLNWKKVDIADRPIILVLSGFKAKMAAQNIIDQFSSLDSYPITLNFGHELDLENRITVILAED